MTIRTIVDVFLRQDATVTVDGDVVRIHDTDNYSIMAAIKLFLMDDVLPEDRAAWATLADTLAANRKARMEQDNA